MEEKSVLQNTLLGALIGLARATDGKTHPTSYTYGILIEGLELYDTAAVEDQVLFDEIEKAHQEKKKLVPRCSTCASPCGRNNDYDVQQMQSSEEDVTPLKVLILTVLCHMAQQVRQKKTSSVIDPAVEQSFAQGLFAVGEDLTKDQLLNIIVKLSHANAQVI